MVLESSSRALPSQKGWENVGGPVFFDSAEIFPSNSFHTFVYQFATRHNRYKQSNQASSVWLRPTETDIKNVLDQFDDMTGFLSQASQESCGTPSKKRNVLDSMSPKGPGGTPSSKSQSFFPEPMSPKEVAKMKAMPLEPGASKKVKLIPLEPMFTSSSKLKKEKTDGKDKDKKDKDKKDKDKKDKTKKQAKGKVEKHCLKK